MARDSGGSAEVLRYEAYRMVEEAVLFYSRGDAKSLSELASPDPMRLIKALCQSIMEKEEEEFDRGIERDWQD